MEGGVWLARLGENDCELLGDGLLRQPVNALSSLAFLAVAGALVWWAREQPDDRRPLLWVYAVAVALNGVGGLLYHGPAWAGATWVHDVALVAPLVFVVLFDASSLRRLRLAHLVGTYAVVMAIVGMVILGLPRYAMAIVTVMAALAFGTELVTAGPRYAWRRSRQAYAVTIAALVVGATFNVLGRTGGPICAEGSVLQGHAAWHVCMAIALGAWAVAAFTAQAAVPQRLSVGAPE